jgi:hypothetical protein
MLINPQALQHWVEHFYGYGSWSAPVWFVGYEETGGDLPEDVASKLDYFLAEHSQAGRAELCDIRGVYRQVAARADGPKSGSYETLHDYRFGDRAALHGVWKNLIGFVHGFLQRELPDLLAYQKDQFAAAASSEAMIQLYPLPSPHAHAWYYSWLDAPGFPYLKSRSLYEETFYVQRIATILDQIRRNEPSLVLMHGMNNINRMKDSVREAFPMASFKMVKAEKLVTPQYHRADLGKTTLLLTTQIPALHHNRKETGFDWFTYGRVASLPLP